jgi:uncharacterized membrane protein YkvA (DUF1232 family)
MAQKLRQAAKELKQQVQLYREVLRHPDCPRSAKWLLGGALGYLALPFDLIPDFIPVLGHVDDLIIVPALFLAARKRIPGRLIEECRAKLRDREASIVSM